MRKYVLSLTATLFSVSGPFSVLEMRLGDCFFCDLPENGIPILRRGRGARLTVCTASATATAGFGVSKTVDDVDDAIRRSLRTSLKGIERWLIGTRNPLDRPFKPLVRYIVSQHSELSAG